MTQNKSYYSNNRPRCGKHPSFNRKPKYNHHINNNKQTIYKIDRRVERNKPSYCIVLDNKPESHESHESPQNNIDQYGFDQYGFDQYGFDQYGFDIASLYPCCTVHKVCVFNDIPITNKSKSKCENKQKNKRCKLSKSESQSILQVLRPRLFRRIINMYNAHLPKIYSIISNIVIILVIVTLDMQTIYYMVIVINHSIIVENHK